MEHTKQRRVLVRSSIDDEPGTSHGTAKLSLESASFSLEKLQEKRNKEDVLGSWKVHDEMNDKEIRIELHDGYHIIPKFTIIIDSGFTFTLFIYN